MILLKKNGFENMAIIRKKELRSLDAGKLEEKVREFRLELAKEKANVDVGSNISSPGRIREIKKTVARIRTIQKEKGGKSG